MLIKRNLSYLSFNLIFSISFTIITFAFLQNNFFVIQGFLIVLFFCNSLLLLLPRIIRAISMNIIIVFLSIYFGTQSVYHRIFNQYGLFQTVLSIQANMLTFIDSVFETMVMTDILFFIVPILTMFISYKLIKQKSIQSSPAYQFLTFLLFITLLFSLTSKFHKELLVSQSKPAKTQDSMVIYANIPNTNHFVSQFGLIGLLIREFDFRIKPIQIMPESSIYEQISSLFVDSNKINLNQFSGIFKGKNLLLIQAESLNNLVIDPILTPTLFKFKTEGILVDGYNSPLLAGSTSDTEFMVNTSLLPTNNGEITYNEYSSNAFPHTLANTFTSNGYYSMASHNNFGVYYNRSVMLPKLGYTFYDSVGIKAEDQVEDAYVIDYIKWIMTDYEHYFSFWVTYTAHQPYTKNTLKESMLSDYDKVEALYPELSENEKVYFAKTMNLDKGLKKFLVDYENSNQLDDMVLIIYGDHYPKGLFNESEQYNNICKKNGNSMENCFDTPLIIWNSQIEANVIKKTSSPLDIAPSIYDLFGLDYQNNIMLGKSVFDSEYRGFNFDENGVIQTNDFTYDTLRETIVLHNWTKTEVEYKLEAESLYNRLLLGYKVVENNYFASYEYRDRFVRK